MSFLTNGDILKLILSIACVAGSVGTCSGQELSNEPSFEPSFESRRATAVEQGRVSSNEQAVKNGPFGNDKILNVEKPNNEILNNEPLEKSDTSSAAISLQALAELQSRTQKIISQSAPAIVAIDETGSGVVVSPSGIVLTASHVTRVAKRRVTVAFSDGRVVEGITLGSNIASDTGAIQLLSPGPFPYVSVGASEAASPGTWCIAMGYPLSFPRGKPATGRLGRVLSRSDNGKLITDCTIMGGDSGGPLFDLDGRVIGISSSVKLAIDQNLHIPSEQFIKDWKNIAMSIDRTSLQTNTELPADQKAKDGIGFRITKRPTGKAYFGINAETDQSIVRIRTVHRQSPAEFAGIQANDVIMKMDAVTITSFSQIVKYLKSKKPGDQISVLINRYGSLLALKVKLGGTVPKN